MKNKRKRKKKSHKNKLFIAIVISVILILITTFVCYKIFLLDKYDVKKLETTNYDNFLKAYNERENITVNHIAVENNDYLIYKNIKIKNVYQDYSIDEELSFESMVTYKKKDASGETIDSIRLSITEESYIDWFAAKEKNFFMSIESDGTSMPLEADITDYLSKNEVDEDLSLFKLLNNTRDFKPNIFTSSKKIKDNYGSHLIASIALPTIDKFIILTGEHNGYIMATENYKEVHIFKDNYAYNLMFTSKTESEILELLNTLIIE